MILNTLESNANSLDVSARHVHSAQMNGGLQLILSLQIDTRSVHEIFKILGDTFIGGRCKKKAAPGKVLYFSISRECKIYLRNLNMEMRVRNSYKKTIYFQ